MIDRFAMYAVYRVEQRFTVCQFIYTLLTMIRSTSSTMPRLIP